ncbi:lysine--tRNA ligase [Candidatus Roizmanbacteria bacterium RIFCSPHIGHO2_01_FULL_39_8]|uniref:Lysine--tRNA ligase n=3 Tax=Candidatus Roizmaniibacteriota TaxID=1752723 RepID=A0A1F7GMD2_9BACT|nr:MAG: lysine--tRNA ligase [Candidatus Roizmanbacteria bacterium RIFCSPHIGHO2_01_FULL_39_8]OGK25221.1 MAG: lysine--tRNA ligase [Candidatus Roizmanbacteria bacterium RIFCSPHIGHO2_02_FULL_39_9]OGK35322.1 MAG: lysine--tRNA ligase [Candidatus Roizmanbacteria bacterium RIFCSPHIGHO2_12_FULL_39_8]
MIWVDRIAKQFEGRAQHVDDMFTPSGFAHMGSLRGPILHDVIYKVLHSKNRDTVFTYVFNDFDTIDGLPPDLKEKFSPYFAWPLSKAPSPVDGYKSFAEYFSSDFKKVLESLGFQANYISSWNMYHEGKFNEVIRIALDNKEKILEIYKKIAGYKKKSSDWHPLQVICPKCGKLGTTKVTGWDGELVTFTCEPRLVTWAAGCGYSGSISPFDGNGKLPWKVDWPAHWKVLGVTFEGAGKDHASRGGSYDIAFALCDEVFHSVRPYYFPYEFFLFGGKKMASSKGIGLKARDLTTILPPEIARFLIVRIPPQKTLEFNPIGEAIPNLFDEYDRCMAAYFDKQEGKIPAGKPGEVLSDFARIYELSEVRLHPKKRISVPRFRTVANLIKNKTDLTSFFAKQKGSKLTLEEEKILKEREQFVEVYLKNYAQDKPTINYKLQTTNFSAGQKEFLLLLAKNLKSAKENKEDIQKIVFDSIKQSGLNPRDAFRAFYQKLTGKDFGPKAGDLILEQGIDAVISKLHSTSN